MSNDHKFEDRFTYGAIGFLVAFVSTIIIVICLSLKSPKLFYGGDFMLNSPEWKIDTIQTVRGRDTTIRYEFVKAKKENEDNE